MKNLKFFGHACFQLAHGDTSIIFDPFLTDNPFKIAQPDDINCNYILVSHGHFDHLGDTIAIAKRTNSTVISTAEIAGLCGRQGCQTHAMHIGGKHTFDFGYVRVTPAFHGAGVEGGHACGFIVNFFGTTIYFAGDTSLFGDMELLGRLEKIDFALLPIGDNFTMGPDDAAIAANMLKANTVIPMHYNTWPLIAQNPEQYKQSVEKQFNIPVQIINPGELINI
ncbi:metal-dependent hydrolase [Dendrosporobacter sp. 1207_IL3150]|uniref:metal-dependent hydrolase n=1 Tax=Dendrosporobacter sp. 1207_IL3150 TaxID=3084054 RepID=UPI002FD9888F